MVLKARWPDRSGLTHGLDGITGQESKVRDTGFSHDSGVGGTNSQVRQDTGFRGTKRMIGLRQSDWVVGSIQVIKQIDMMSWLQECIVHCTYALHI